MCIYTSPLQGVKCVNKGGFFVNDFQCFKANIVLFFYTHFN